MRPEDTHHADGSLNRESWDDPDMEIYCMNATMTTEDSCCHYRDTYDNCRRPIGADCELDLS